MTKIPDSLKVKFTISDIEMEVPKSFFESAAIKAAVFFGRKGKGAVTRRTKWFTLADPSLVGSSTRQMVALPPPNENGHEDSTRRETTTKIGGEENAESTPHHVTGELAVFSFGALNNVVYETELKPLNKFDNVWVFDQKLTHPVTVFAKVFIKMRPGAKGNAARSEQESNLNDMLQMDQSEMDDDDDDDFSGGDNDGVKDPNEESHMDISNVMLTADEFALLMDGKSENEILIDDLRQQRNCKKRYLAFPKEIDLGSVANTKTKHIEYSDRVRCKSASLLGSVISFKITAEIDESKLAKYDAKVKDKEDKEERKRREKEEKILEKERKKQEKEMKKREEKERKKRGEKEEKVYGCDVTNTADNANTAQTTEASKSTQPEAGAKAKTSHSPFHLIRGMFSAKEKTQTTPFPIKFEHTPYPFIFLLDNFVLHKLVMPPEFYRGVHIRLGCDPVAIDGYPLLLLNTETKSFLKEESINGYDGKPKNIFKFDFGSTHVYFGDRNIRNITGFDTIRALTEHEKTYIQLKERAAEDAESQLSDSCRGSTDLFRAEILNVGETFRPMVFQATKYSANEAQVESTKYTRVTAQLVIPKDVKNVKMMTDEQEKKAYLKSIKKLQKAREKEEKERLKAEKKAAKAGQAESSDDDNDVPDTTTNHESSHPTAETHEETEAATAVVAPETQEDTEAGANSEDKVENNGAEAAEVTFEGGGEDEQAKDTPAGEPKASKDSRFSLNKTSSFQLGFQLVNEENIPADGIQYAIRFHTGEELKFRARRVFLPSLCAYGDDGASKTDVPLLSFSPNA